ncbi:MAG: menaquinone-dependent protoporphyrinogen IX dehydrogenase [Vicinamibacterales bacterium]|nr:menaquinone-dependent protoporphyrinogen IX dehydrogenase [Vicinamibacterales bacterium]
MRVLIVYGTVEGQTRKIAEYIGQIAGEAGHAVDLRDAATLAPDASIGKPDAVIIGAPVHQGRHPAALRHFVTAHAATLQALPTGFFSVSLASVLTGEEHLAEGRKYVEGFCAETGWTPGVTALVAGALRYSQYDFFKRFIMKLIAREQGGDTDTSRDYEYTDWSQVRQFAHDVLALAARGIGTS